MKFQICEEITDAQKTSQSKNHKYYSVVLAHFKRLVKADWESIKMKIDDLYGYS